MTPADVLDVARDSILVLIRVAGPIMMVGLVTGLSIAFFQALTSINEMTLTFVPKILAIFVSLLIFLPFMMTTMIAFMERMAERMVALQ